MRFGGFSIFRRCIRMETGGKTPHPPFATRGRFKQGNILVYSPVYAQNLDSLVGTGVPDGP